MKIFEVRGKQLFTAAGLLLLLVIAAGCSEAEKFSWQKLKETQYRMVTGQNLQAKPEPAAQQGAETGVTVLPGRQNKGESAEMKAGPLVGKNSSSKVQVALYFADQGGDYLAAETREITLVPALARVTIEQLISGPKDKKLTGTIPAGTKVLDLNIDQGLCRVDLSREFRDNHWGGSTGEILTVYSLVNTLTQFSSVEKVEILVEGQKINTLAGHMDLSRPVYRNSQIVKEVK